MYVYQPLHVDSQDQFKGVMNADEKSMVVPETMNEVPDITVHKVATRVSDMRRPSKEMAPSPMPSPRPA